ncbi:MAG: amidohydrolase family protein [Gemmatimonadetes bacterium]|nr:amidohydrolase family protein [Gemmatimonadota bacterium]
MLLFLALPLLAAPMVADTVRPPIAITGVTVIDATGAAPAPGMTVLIAGDRIVSVTPAGAARPPRGAIVVDGRGKYLIPGLWDMHMHLANRPLRPDSNRVRGLERNRAAVFPLLLASGVTGVRDMAGDLAVLRRWRDEAATGAVPGPRLVITGRKVGKNPVTPEAPFPIGSDADVLRSVQLLVEGGADFVKVDGLEGRYYLRLFQAANAAGLNVAGHTAIDLGAVTVARMGQRSIEHLDGVVLACAADEASIRADALAEEGWWRRLLARVGLSHPEENFRRRYREMLATQSDPRTDSVLAVFRGHETWQVPTLVMLRDIRLVPPSAELAGELRRFPGLSSGEPSTDVRWAGDTTLAHQLYRRELAILGGMIRQGVPILAGTDGPGGTRLPGASLHDELALLVEAGMSPMQALQSATREAARFLGRQDTQGTIAVGQAADLVLLSADPLADISNTRRIAGVVARGRYYGPAALDSLRAVAAGASAP